MFKEKIVAFIISVLVGCGGKIAFDLSYKKMTRKNIIQSLMLGLFVSFIAYGILQKTHLESWQFVIIPFVAYSSTYILQFWHTDNRDVLRHILQFFLIRLNSSINKNENEKIISTEDNSRNDTSDGTDSSVSGN